MTGLSNVMAAMVLLPFSAVVNPNLATATGTSSPLTTNSVTVAAANGVAPYSYAWTFVSGQPFTCNSPAVATTSWTTNIGPGTEKQATWACTVTDSTPVTPKTVVVQVSLDVIRS